MMRLKPWNPGTFLLLVAAACGGEPDPEPDPAGGAAGEPGMAEPATTATADRRVEIVAPADGDTLDAGPVVVRLANHGFDVVPAGDMTPNSGHHHLFLDREVSPAGDPIPVEEGYIVHMGTGASEFTLPDVAPGEHRLIAVVGDAVHVPLDPPLMDTIHFVVRQ